MGVAVAVTTQPCRDARRAVVVVVVVVVVLLWVLQKQGASNTSVGRAAAVRAWVPCCLRDGGEMVESELASVRV
jgi:hypothetical protein